MKALIHPGLFTAHDIWHQVARLYHYHQAFLDGQIPPYWITDLANGFGYPLFFFSYHLPWMIGIPFLTLGFDIPTTIKILFFISYLLSGIAMYLFVFEVSRNRFAALFSSILYMWAPYHFLTILVSAAMGTAFVFAFLPLILWGIYRGSVLIIAAGISGSILSHLITTVSLTPLIMFFTIWTLNIKPGNLKKIAHGILLGAGLAVFYLLPAIFYSREIQASSGAFGELYKKQFVNLSQLVYSKWGYGITDNAKDAVISYQVGIAQWLSLLATLLFLIFQRRLTRFHLIKTAPVVRNLNIALVIVFAISVFLMLDNSKPLWDFSANFITLDYPTIFLLTTTFAGSLMGEVLVASTNKKLSPLVFIVFLFITFYTNRNHLRVNEYTYIPVEDYVAAELTTNSYHEYLPKTADPKLLSEPVPLGIHHFSFPGITLYVGGKRVAYETDERGMIVMPSNVTNKEVSIKFEDTNLIKISKLITIAAIVIFGILSWQKGKDLKLLQ